MHLLILGTCLSIAYAMPSYIAVPADQIAFLDLTALRARRIPRQTAQPVPELPQALYEDNYHPIALENYHQGTVALAPPPVPEAPLRVQQDNQEEENSSSDGRLSRYTERQPDFGEYVDFGAHTGDNGAFGWYADYPVNNQHNSGYSQ